MTTNIYVEEGEKVYVTYFTFTLFLNVKNAKKKNINEKCVNICNITPTGYNTQHKSHTGTVPSLQVTKSQSNGTEFRLQVEKVVYLAHKHRGAESQTAVLQGSYTFYYGGIWRGYLGNELI
jgi:hypothetical protein